jgi:8-oxo-dGTP pyrophosphatase MutT (NUDIX family)
MIKNFCLNCGEIGHGYKRCKEPTISIGIICMKFSNKVIKNKILQNFKLNKKNNLDKKINFNKCNILKKYINDIKFLLIRRKHSLGYLEFIRGKYDIQDEKKILKLFSIMTPYEKEDILKNDFDLLWTNIWKKTSYIQIYQIEYNKSKNKFNKLRETSRLRELIKKSKLLFKTPEWGFPKGKRSKQENNLQTAIREFNEETNLKNKDIVIIENLEPFSEVFIGSNNKKYKHIYYFGIYNGLEDDLKVKNYENEFEEIGDIGWFNYIETYELIRDYHFDRKKIITKIFNNIALSIDNISKVKNELSLEN